MSDTNYRISIKIIKSVIFHHTSPPAIHIIVTFSNIISSKSIFSFLKININEIHIEPWYHGKRFLLDKYIFGWMGLKNPKSE